MSDPYWSNVTLAMHMDGVNNSTTFTDLKGHSVTPYGDAKISTTQSKFGGASAYFDGSGDYLSTPNLISDFGTGNFTFESFVYLNNSNGNALFSYFNQVSTSPRILGYISTTQVIFDFNLNGGGSGNYTVIGNYIGATNQWLHVAITRSANVVYLFANGVLLNSGSFPVNINWNAPFKIGAFDTSAPAYNLYFNGYIDDLRITKGVARYTSNFTPPTQAFPDSDVATNTSSMFLVF